MTPKEKQQEFYNEFKALLRKYNAEIMIEDFGHGYILENKIVIDFNYDEAIYLENETGIIPQLVIGKFEDGK